MQYQQDQEKKKKKERQPLLKNEYGYFLLDKLRVENQKSKGYTMEDHECWGYLGFLETAQYVINKRKNMCATYQPGASKCNVKKVNEIAFFQDEFRATIMYGRMMLRLGDGRAIYVIENIQLKNKENTSSNGTFDCPDLEEAIYTYIEHVNSSLNDTVVATFGSFAKRLVYKKINDIETDNVQGLYGIFIGKEINHEILKKEQEENEILLEEKEIERQQRKSHLLEHEQEKIRIANEKQKQKELEQANKLKEYQEKQTANQQYEYEEEEEEEENTENNDDNKENQVSEITDKLKDLNA